MSASTRTSSKYGENNENATESMRSTFTDGFQNSDQDIPKLPKDKCVLDFDKSEMEILKEIAELMKKEQEDLETRIQETQDSIFNHGKKKVAPKPEPEVIEEPTPKELFEFKSRLEVRTDFKDIIFRKLF